MTVPLAGLFMTTILQRLSASIVAKEECTTVSSMISTLYCHIMIMTMTMIHPL